MINSILLQLHNESMLISVLREFSRRVTLTLTQIPEDYRRNLWVYLLN